MIFIQDLNSNSIPQCILNSLVSYLSIHTHFVYVLGGFFLLSLPVLLYPPFFLSIPQSIPDPFLLSAIIHSDVS